MSKNHNYLEAVQMGDLSAVKYYLELQPEVDLNYQDAKLRSALHWSVKSSKNSQQIVKSLIEAGIDCSLRNSLSQTAAEFARHEGKGDLLLLMLEYEFKNVSVPDVFYQLLRRGSMEMVCVFVEMKKLPILEAIHFTEQAYDALRLKGVKLPEQVQYEVEQELVNYYSNTRTFCEIEVSDEEILRYIDFVLDNTDEKNLNEVSDTVLEVLRELAKQMYLVKHRYDEAMMEVQYCLCIFIAIYDNLEDVALYTLVINKQMLLKFLHLVSKQLRNNGNTLSRRNRKVRKQLRKTFVILKEVSSVGKIVRYLETACGLDLNMLDDKFVGKLAIDRCIQVLGEAIKSTKLSPIISRKIETAFEYIVSNATSSNYISTREYHSHGYPVIKYLQEKEKNNVSYRKMQLNFQSILSFFKCMFSTLLIKISKRFLGSLYNMKTIMEMRSLAMFARMEFISSFEHPLTFGEMFYSEQVVFKLMNELKNCLKDDLTHLEMLLNLDKRLMNYFNNTTKQNYNYKNMAHSLSNFINVVKGAQNIDSIKSVLKFPLLHSSPTFSISFCKEDRRIISGMARSLLSSLLEMSLETKDYQNAVDTAMQLFNQLDHSFSTELDMVGLKQTNRALERYIKGILHGCAAHDKVFAKITQKQLKGMGRNVFNVDERFKTLDLPDSPTLRAFRKKQEDELQNAFEHKIKTLKKLILTASQPTGSGPYHYSMNETSIVQFAMEQLLLEICEILLGVGKIKPNLHLLRHRVPVICGKNLRDGLAHDMLMYSVFSQSRRHLICNAIYYANISMKLYENTETDISALLCSDKNISIFDKLYLFDIQNDLYEQLKNFDTFEPKDVQIEEADLLGRRRETYPDFTMHRSNTLIHAIKHNVQLFVGHIDSTKPSELAQALIQVVDDPLIPRKRPNQLTASEKSRILLSITLLADNFTLYREIAQKCNASLTYEAAFKQNQSILNHLDELKLPLSRQMLFDSIETGNISAFKELLNKMDNRTIVDCSPLLKALVAGQREMADLLVKLVKPSEKEAEIAIIYNFNSILKHVDPSELQYQTLLKYAVARDNLDAIKLMENKTNIYQNMTNLLHDAALLKRTSILEHLIQNDVWRSRIDELDENNCTAIEICAQNANYSAVKLLSQHTTNVRSAIIRAGSSNSNRIVKYLLGKTYHLLRDIHLTLIDKAIENKNHTLLRYLLRRKTTMDLSEQFLGAINFCNLSALEQLLQQDPQCSQSIRGDAKYNAFHFAVQSLNLIRYGDDRIPSNKIFNLLAAHKVDPTAKDSRGMTPLHHAVSFGNLKIISQMYRLAPTVINESDKFGRTPLITALIAENLTVTEFLLKKGANTNMLAEFKLSLLPNDPPITHFLTKNTECLKFAIKTLNVEPDLVDRFGRTLLHELCRKDNARMVAFLLENCNANIAAQDIYGENVWHHAVRSDSKAVLEFLTREPRCEMDQPNVNGQTPLLLAMIIPNRFSMAQKLIMTGASKEMLLLTIAGICREALTHIQ